MSVHHELQRNFYFISANNVNNYLDCYWSFYTGIKKIYNFVQLYVNFMNKINEVTLDLNSLCLFNFVKKKDHIRS